MYGLFEKIKNWFQIDNNTFATIIITISIAVFGVIVNMLIKAYNNYQSRKGYRKLLIDILMTTKKDSASQASNFKKFTSNLTLDHHGITPLKSLTITHLTTIRNISFENFYSSLFSGIENIFCVEKKRKFFEKTFSCIAKLEQVEKIYRDDLWNFVAKYNSFEEKLNEALSTYRKSYEDWMTSINGTKVQDIEYLNFINALQDIHIKWTQMENRTFPKIRHENFVSPSLQLGRQHGKKYEIARRLTDYLLVADYQYQNLENIITAYRSMYLSYYYSYRYSEKVIALFLKKVK